MKWLQKHQWNVKLVQGNIYTISSLSTDYHFSQSHININEFFDVDTWIEQYSATTYKIIGLNNIIAIVASYSASIVKLKYRQYNKLKYIFPDKFPHTVSRQLNSLHFLSKMTNMIIFLHMIHNMTIIHYLIEI